MKFIKITSIIFVFTLCFVFIGASAGSTSSTFANVTIKSLSRSTEISTHYKNNYGNQSIWQIDALDDLSNDKRAMKAKVDSVSGTWDDLKTDEWVNFSDSSTVFSGVNYTLYIKAKKSTLSTVSWWGTWSWDKDMKA